ncbi:hypothetical protein SAY87_014602 [Trapa incisa]|uniref:Uncharacterized protein n=2 Tax=Trapa TaxID=22665 RepID=A0AAN7N2W0_TRANT|nr:hypothetical protein SAY87_014602 [Trapa incisa]KAK4803003.1 hypothetical protein SAY86_001206 [Trapa natans]
MDPQAFIRLSIGSLGLRIPGTNVGSLKPGIPPLSSSLCSCEIRLRGFPTQTTTIPFFSSPEATPDSHSIASSFYLEESDLRALSAPSCFYNSQAYLEITVFTGKKESRCGVGIKRQQVGTFRLGVGPEWSEGKPLTLLSGWIGIGKSKVEAGKPVAELHVRVKLDPDPRYVFQFDDVTRLSPQIVQLQGSIKQPIFSCKFSRDRVSQVDPWSSAPEGSNQDHERRERKGWKVKIHDLSGSAVAAAFITTPFVPSSGCGWVARSNPGAWLIVRPDPCGGPEAWQPWGKLEAWRERGMRDSVCCRFRLLSEGVWGGGGEVLLPEISINAERGGEFFIDTDKQAKAANNAQQASPSPIPSPHSSGDFAGLGPAVGGFVMSCRIQGEAKNSKPLVHLAMRHVTCVEDAAIFMALAAAVDLSIEACKPFRRRIRRGPRHSM